VSSKKGGFVSAVRNSLFSLSGTEVGKNCCQEAVRRFSRVLLSAK